MADCATCFQAKIPACNGLIYIVSGIPDFENYFWKVTDHFGNVFTGECTPSYSGSGAFVIDPDGDPFPDGMFTENSGAYKIQVVDAYGCVQTMNFCGVDYTCISLTLFKNSGGELQSQIQCC